MNFHWVAPQSSRFVGKTARSVVSALFVAGFTSSALVLSGCTSVSALGATASITTFANNSATADTTDSALASDLPSDSATASTVAPTNTASVAGANPGTALALLANLPIKGRAPKTGYDRVADFGTAWKDVDKNGCDTRNDMLALDLTSVVKSGKCKVLSGTLVSAYSGATIQFVRGETTSALVQIDHIVALSDAWQTGAQQISQAKREALANDPLNLQPVEGSLNDQKGDSDAASWLPPLKSYRCTYVARQVSVKAAYGLWVTQAEHDVIANILATCPNQVAYKSNLASGAN